MALFELLVEQFEKSLSVCFFNGPPVSAREERSYEAVCVFSRVIGNDFDGNLLRSWAEAASSSARSGKPG